MFKQKCGTDKDHHDPRAEAKISACTKEKSQTDQKHFPRNNPTRDVSAQLAAQEYGTDDDQDQPHEGFA
jgi:hypothetical protein